MGTSPMRNRNPKIRWVFLERIKNFRKAGGYFLNLKKLFEKRMSFLGKSKKIVGFPSKVKKPFTSKNACFLSEPFLMSEVPLYV